MSSAIMLDSELDKETVYLAYRDVFKDKLAKLRKRSKTQQLKAAFPTLFTPGQLGNDTAIIVKCVGDSLEDEHGHENGKSNDAPPVDDIFNLVDDTPMPDGAFLEESEPVLREHRIDKKSGRIRKPIRATENSTVYKPSESNWSWVQRRQSRGREKGKDVLKRARDWDFTPANSACLPSRLQNLILTQAQRLLEECCYDFAEKWFPSMLIARGWDSPESVELTKWCKSLLKCDISAEATALNNGQSLADIFMYAISIRNCAVHRRPQASVKKVEEMIRDASMLAQVLKDDLRAAKFLLWHKELKKLTSHLQSITQSRREAPEVELREIHNESVAIEGQLAGLKTRAYQLTQSLDAKGKTNLPIDGEALQSLEEAFSKPMN